MSLAVQAADPRQRSSHGDAPRGTPTAQWLRREPATQACDVDSDQGGPTQPGI